MGMNRDAIERLALNRAVEISAELEVQLDKNAKLQPMVVILAIAREQAAIAMRGLVMVDPNDTKQVREFQNEVRRYDDLVDWTQKLIVAGKEADRRLDQMERDELDDIFNNPEVADERRAIGETAQDI
jgi:hypothetical protein